jgi:formylglycine-generating enzyme required for sulfatase activity
VTHQVAVQVEPLPTQIPPGKVYIPGGVFRMGDKDARDVKGLLNERPPHDVELTSFYMDAREVTNAQYQQCVQAGACTQPHYADDACYDPMGRQIGAAFQNAAQPVVCVDWQQAKSFCEYADQRLPTEAEWEKAAAGPEGYMWSFGNAFDATQANTAENSQGIPVPVGSYPANGYGLYDMSGNVSEWVEDQYDEAFYAKPEASRPNPVHHGSGAGTRVQRGGAWWHGIEGVRTTRRHWESPDEVSTLVGFRCAKSLLQAAP